MSKNMLSLPEERVRILDALVDLADDQMQRDRWRDKKPHASIPWRYTLTDIVHALLDDLNPFHEDAAEMIGESLRNEEEFHSLRRTANLLLKVVKTHKDNLTDAQYMQLPEWPAIVAAARATLAEFNKP